MRWVLFLLAAVSVAGCFKAQAKTPAPPAALLTPAPPDRIIVAVPVPEAVEAEAPVPATAGPTAPPRTPPARPPTERPAPVSPPAAPPAVVTEAPTPPPVLLQTTSNPAEVEQRARELIAVANRDLAAINLSLLSANARAQYESARGFVRQAESALQVKNVVLARELADKAASLASQLRR
jgi:hypothetical protein